MRKQTKPPIGATPFFVAIPMRIMDLADSILRYSGCEGIGRSKEITDKIREWANEIICQCNALDKLQDLKERRGEKMSELIICEHEYGGYAVRPADWSGIWTQDIKLKTCCPSVSVFTKKEDAEEYVRLKNLQKSGKLQELPYAIGDTVYEVHYDVMDNPQYYIAKYKVEDISTKAIKYAKDWHELDILHDTYFDREAAETRLRELAAGGTT